MRSLTHIATHQPDILSSIVLIISHDLHPPILQASRRAEPNLQSEGGQPQLIYNQRPRRPRASCQMAWHPAGPCSCRLLQMLAMAPTAATAARGMAVSGTRQSSTLNLGPLSIHPSNTSGQAPPADCAAPYPSATATPQSQQVQGRAAIEVKQSDMAPAYMNSSGSNIRRQTGDWNQRAAGLQQPLPLWCTLAMRYRRYSTAGPDGTDRCAVW